VFQLRSVFHARIGFVSGMCFRHKNQFGGLPERDASPQVGAGMKDKNLCLIRHQFETVNTDSKVLIYKLEEVSGTLGQAAPFAEIPVRERMSDREACLMAMAWLREHHHITTAEYFREVEKFFLNESAHPTEAVDCDMLPRRGSYKADNARSRIQ
jgi:hypothetical protein